MPARSSPDTFGAMVLLGCLGMVAGIWAAALYLAAHAWPLGDFLGHLIWIAAAVLGFGAGMVVIWVMDKLLVAFVRARSDPNTYGFMMFFGSLGAVAGAIAGAHLLIAQALPVSDPLNNLVWIAAAVLGFPPGMAVGWVIDRLLVTSISSLVDFINRLSIGWYSLTGGGAMTPQEMEKLWAEHIKHEFETKDVEATLATMVEDASVDHVPVHTGGKGKEQLRPFYRDHFIPSWPDDTEMTSINRVVGQDQLVDEIRTRFTHTKLMDWFLPGVPPTNRVVEIDIIVVVQFRDGKLACERIYWDQATVLRQVGLLKDGPLAPEE